MRIEPTVGRVVYFWPFGTQTEQQPHAATIAFVRNSEIINIGWLDHEGNHANMTDVRLVQAGEPRPADGPFCEWMQYQIGQAKAHANAAA